MKQKLLLALLALFTLGGSNLYAQTWTGSVVGEGTYYLYNVGADKFVAYGSSWGTKAIVDEVGIPMTLESSNGKYKIKTNVNSGNNKFYLGAGFYVDQDACDFTFTPVEGKTNVYNLSYMENGTTEKFRMWVTGAKAFDQISSISAGATWTLESTQWMLISQEERDAKFAAGDPLDITYKYINDPNTSYFSNIYNPEQSWTSGSWGMEKHDKEGTWRDKCGEVWNGNYDVYKLINDVPNGLYRFSIQGFYRDGSTPSDNYVANAKLYANDAVVDMQSVTVGATETTLGGRTIEATNGFIPDNREAACYYFQADKYPFQSVEVLVSNNTLKFGVKKETLIGGDWTVVDKFRLTYVDPAISAKAVALPDNGAMVAGQWYYFTIPVEADYTLTSDNLSEIVYTTSGKTILISEESTVTSVFDAANQTLPAGTYYVKSSTDNNLTMALNAFSYVVGEPTTSIANGATLQSLTTFTATFNNAATNDPDATFALLNNETKALLTKDGSVVAEGTLSLEGQALTATFPETTLELGGAYVLTIPSGVVGYNDQATNEEIIVNISTPAIADGYYFLRDSQGRYVGRGSSYNTRALMEPYGLPLYVETNEEGITTFTFIDSNQKLFDAGNGTVYTDNTSNPNWKVEATNDGYYIINKNNNGSYDKKLGTDGGTWMQSNDNGLVWTFEPASEHNTHMEALKDQEAAAAATAAGIEGITNRSTLEAKLSSDYIPQTISIDDVAWNEKYQVGAGSEYAGNGVKYYENSISGLKPGLYKLTAKAYYRLTWNATVDAAAGARGNVYLYGNNAKTQLYSVFDFPADEPWVSGNDYQDGNGKYYPNNPNGSQAAFSADNYVNELFVYVSADEGAETGTLNYGIHQPSRFGGNGQWCAYQDFTLTYYTDNNDIADANDYDALNAAIQAAEANTLGFEANEYAPYNNIEAITALKAGQAIDQTIENSQEDVQAATAAIAGASWTANTKEVNAIWDGSFEHDYSGQSGNINPIGWQRVKGAAADGYNVRLMNGSNAGLAATTSGKALFTKQSAYYGYANGYTMPLKANTMYKITFIYGGWGDCKKDGYVSMAAPDGSAVTLSVTDLPVDATNADADVNAWKQYEATFTTGEAGDYVLGLRKKNYDTSGQSQYVYGDIVLVKATADDIKVQLQEELNTANTINKEANVGTAAFQIPESAANALTSDISNAQGVYDNATATVEDVLNAIEELKAAEDAYKNAELNAPADGQLFNIILTYSGWDYDNKAITFIANGRNDQGNYSIQYKEVANQNLAQAFTFTKVDGNNYRLSQIDADGNTRYVTDGKTGYNSGDGSGIRTTTDIEKSAAFKIIATATDGVYNIWNNVKGDYIGSQDIGVFTVNSHIDFMLQETQKPSITINTTAAGWGTTILPFAVSEIPEGVKVYSCLEDKGATLELTEVNALEANKPYIIEGAWDATLTGDAQGTALSNEDGQLVGTYVKIAAPNACYVLQKQGDKVGFFKVDTSVAQPNVPANRAYMKASASGAKAFYLGEDTNGINAIEALISGNAEIFNINGVKQNSLQKGINIIKAEDGKTHKIMVK